MRNAPRKKVCSGPSNRTIGFASKSLRDGKKSNKTGKGKLAGNRTFRGERVNGSNRTNTFLATRIKSNDIMWKTFKWQNALLIYPLNSLQDCWQCLISAMCQIWVKRAVDFA